MKLETIKRNNKKKIIIGSMIVLSVVGCLTLTTTRAKYRSVQSIKLASGTINYKASDLHIVAVKTSEDGTNYTDKLEIPTSGYTLNIEKSKCRIPTSTLNGENAPADESIPIEYKEGKVYIGINKKNTKCYLYFDKKLTSEDTIAKLNVRNIKAGTPDFTQVATGAETEDNNGVYVTDDPMYGTNAKTYYWRGAATTNHVIFDNKCWRIVRINGDGSIRLIYNGAVQSNNTCKGNGSWDGNIVLQGTAYNSVRNNSKYVGWTYGSDIQQRPSENVPQNGGDSVSLKTALETWYNDDTNISVVARKKIVPGYFCNDRNTKDGETWRGIGDAQYYAAYQRLLEGTKKPTLTCSNGDIYELNIGMITADEVQFAGASGTLANKSYYLYNGRWYWTMSPYHWNSGDACTFVVFTDGSIAGSLVSYTDDARPVINLRSDVTFNSGSDGTQNNPYIVQ